MFNYKCVLLQRTPICLLWCSLKAIFSCFVPHHMLLHVSCILLVSKFNANKQINWLMSIFKALCQIHKNVYNVFKNTKFGQNPKSIFLQYDVLLRTPSLLSRAYLVHFVRQFFLCFSTKTLVLVLKGYLTKFSTVYKGYQMRLGLKDLLQCV